MSDFPFDSSRAWHTVEAREVAAALQVPQDGLSDDEAAARLERFGPNEVAAERLTPWWRILLHQFTDPLIYVLVAAAAVTLLMRDYTDSGVILGVVVLNAAIGFIQEYRAQQAMKALARMSAPKADVTRSGEQRELPSRDLVPGDLVVLGSGARVPADLRLTKVRDLEADESALTGESVPARKTPDALEKESLVPGDQTNMAFAGTIVTRGRGRGIVVRTGLSSEIGRIAAAVREIGDTTSPLKEKMYRFGHQVGYAILGLCALVLAIGLLQGMAASEIIPVAVALAVASIPEGLPVVLTVTMAIGVRRMARRNAIIRALPAVETLGSTTVIGSDKTGTLTKNEMTVRLIWAGGIAYELSGAGYDLAGEIRPADPADGEMPRDGAEEGGLSEPLRITLECGVLANEVEPGAIGQVVPKGDPTEIALHVASAKVGIDPSGLRRQRREVDLLPFEPERRFMATLNETPHGLRVHAKGAPEAILDRCEKRLGARGTEDLAAGEILAAARDMAARGLRVLAMAYREANDTSIEPETLQQGLVFAGLQGMEDPVRPEAISAVETAHEAGIRVIMLTGDHLRTAAAIGAQLGLGDPDGMESAAAEGARIESLDDEELDLLLADVDVYARVTPEHKLRIVQRLKAAGEIVAVTGDGVNDAPALRAAHLGVAMGKGGTDVAREASDMVLADDNFATITAAVEEGRVVFANVRKVTFFLLSTAVGQVLAILAALLLGWPIPFLAVQILWVNLVTNGLQDIALAFEPGEPGLLRRRPRHPSEGVVTLRIVERLGAVGAVLAGGTLGVFWWTLETGANVDYARTLAMTQMVAFQFFHVFNSRSLDRSIFTVPPLSNPFLFISLIAAAVAHVAVIYATPLQALFRTVPLDPADWLLIIAVGSSVILGGEADKWRNRRKGRLLG